MWGLFKTDLHLFGVEDSSGTVYLLGTDSLGRDLLSRILYGARISLTIGLIGVMLTFILGLTIGSVSGYFGGRVDGFIQRIIEVLRSFPTFPLWMALSAALPAHWSPVRVYFGITLVLSFLAWTSLARVVRGKILSLREEDFAMAARLSGAGNARIMFRHLLPSFTSHIVVSLTLMLPHMILGETSLSFLGLGLRPPITSWGVLLKDAQNVQAVSQQPWLLTPAIMVILVVLAFNFVGDGLRDAADPYSR
jgi:peptide/nickel transport system permease protein